MKKRWHFSILVVLFACEPPPAEFAYINMTTPNCPAVLSTFLIEVALDPESFDGYCIGVAGYYRGDLLFLSKEDSAHVWGVPRLMVAQVQELTEPPCTDTRLFIAGRFEILDGSSGILIPEIAWVHGEDRTRCLSPEPAA
jgi:hypothetical protein